MENVKLELLLIFSKFAERYFSLNEQVPNLTQEDYLNQIKEYYYHSILYASDNVIINLKVFIESPNQGNYMKVAKAMRYNIWGKKTSLTFEQIKLT